ncbi:hypothetical protein [Paenibacillus macquariensis]|uniref:Uncharacterized protein n=1 Tax=Paenibacillus macquariensis TaxID=948756 RepID=A0ABY1JX78_9BACL|nr:hypothetical protein [Paenibacillus macquariensis]MEC0089378.1 hypothetical protein [Paenibacillus macquariensis]OAB33231.1 hypothetical protein PMSM_14540 [Paenibacillus macquariensis subsp. macquariensis]SIQ92601.1 hypothetical protein SAMN05421578_10580 [Paenibacillus macquariensis]
MKYQFKGIIRGTYSWFQASGFEEVAVYKFEDENLHELLDGLAIDEWSFVLKVNGRRIKNVIQYLKRNKLNPENYMRYQNGEWVA